MKKYLLILLLILLCITWSCFLQKERIKSLYELQNAVTTIPADDLSIMNAPAEEEGNAEAGYKYMVEGKAFGTGIPMEIYKAVKLIKNSKLARMAGYSKFTMNDFVIFKNDNGQLTATPGCLHCHAQQFNGELIIGLGNSYSNFQINTTPYLKLIEIAIKVRYGKNSKEWKTAEMAFGASHVLDAKIQTQMQGPAPAQKIAEVMASHRDPVTLIFRADTNYFSLPSIVIPEDVPALWIAKKKKGIHCKCDEAGQFFKTYCHLLHPYIERYR